MNTQKLKLKYNYYSIRNVKYLGRKLDNNVQNQYTKKI